jgi:hypothetical protein
MGSGDWVSRTFSGLPTHDNIMISLKVWRLDSFNDVDGLQIELDGLTVYLQSMNYNRLGSQDLCGVDFYPDPGPLYLTLRIPHDSDSVSIKVTCKTDQDKCNESCGIRDVYVMAKMKYATESLVLYQQGAVPALVAPGITKTLTCQQGTFSFQGSCVNCDPSCRACTGRSSSDCLICNKGYYYNGLTCLDCAANCRSCMNDSANSCTSCLDSYFLYEDGTCRSACKGNVAISELQPIQCTCSLGSFVYKNNSCLTGCEAGYIIDGINCNFKCKDKVFFKNDTCGSTTTCPSPFKTTDVQDGIICEFPCSSSQFLYDNGTCISTCPSPFIKISQGIENYCKFPCSGSLYYNPNNRQCAPCPSPWTSTSVGVEKYCNFVCTKNCETCNPKLCTKCKPGFKLSTDQECVIDCGDNYYLKDGTCSSEKVPVIPPVSCLFSNFYFLV